MKLDLPKEREFDAGLWYATPVSSWYPVHHHDELELNIIVSGRAVIRIGREQLAVRRGSQILLPPGQEHALLNVSEDFAMWVSSFRPHVVHEIERPRGQRILAGNPGFWSCSVPSSRLRALSTACAAHLTHEHPRQLNPLSRRLLVGALDAWHEQRRQQISIDEEPEPEHSAVVRARELLRSPEGDVPFESLAYRCGLSPSRLSRLFKDHTGVSVVQFRSHHRVQRFIAELGRGNARNMLEVALEVGFGSYPQFHRAFRQVTGYSPAQHLKRVQAGVVVPVSHIEQQRTVGFDAPSSGSPTAP